MGDIEDLEKLRADIEKEIDGLWEVLAVINSLKTVIEYVKRNGK